MAEVAGTLRTLLENLLQTRLPVRLRAWDGSETGPPEAPVVVVSRRRAVRRLIWQPNALGLARAYVSGDIDVKGDLYEALGRLAALLWRAPESTSLPVRAVAGDLLRLGAVGAQPKPPPEEIA